MDKKKKILKILDIVLVIGIFVSITLNTYNMLAEGLNFKEFIEQLKTAEPTETMFAIGISFLFAIISFAFSKWGFISFGYVVYRIIDKKITKKNKKHPKFALEYFRDDLDGLSPAYMSYLIDYDINIDVDMPAHILKLQLDGYIKEENNNFFVTDKNQEKLSESDKIILEIVNNNFEYSSLFEQYKRQVETEMISLGYIKKLMPKNIFQNLISIMFLINFISIFSTALFMKGTFVVEGIGAILFFIFMIINMIGPFVLGGVSMIYTFVRTKKGDFERTDKGNEMLEKVYGLKNFLEDFTNVDDSTLKESSLREYYLVYALVLGINDKIDDEMINKVKNHVSINR